MVFSELQALQKEYRELSDRLRDAQHAASTVAPVGDEAYLRTLRKPTPHFSLGVFGPRCTRRRRTARIATTRASASHLSPPLLARVPFVG